MAENKKSFNRGYVAKTGENKATGALHLFVSNDRENRKSVRKATVKVNGKDRTVLNISAYGFFAGPSGIAYALGEGVLKENGACNVDIAVWDKTAEFTEKANLKPGDIIEVYARDFHKEVSDSGFVTIRCNADKVELERRKPATAPAAGEVPAAPAPDDDVPEEDESGDINWD